ncbi:MAG: hypothetical protein U0744_15500 [Gemmataceae bacterium]
MEYFHEGSPTTTITEARAGELLDGMLAKLREKGELRRVLLIPPDITRMHAWAGFLTCALYERLKGYAEIQIPARSAPMPR